MTEHDALDERLQRLFADVQPAAGFEDRLIAALPQPRLRLIPAPVRKAALAAAAMLVVGATGYVGTRAINGGPRFSFFHGLHPSPTTAPSNGRLQKGDDLVVTVNDLVGLGVESSRQVTVDQNGNIQLPLIGPIAAEGKTEGQLQQTIADSYRTGQIITNAQVSATKLKDALAGDINIDGLVVDSRSKWGQAPFSHEHAIRPGIDTSGGTSLNFEINGDIPAAQSSKPLADQVMEAMKRRVEPDGVKNYVQGEQDLKRLPVDSPQVDAGQGGQPPPAKHSTLTGDNRYSGGRLKADKTTKLYDGLDSILLPHAGSQGGDDQKGGQSPLFSSPSRFNPTSITQSLGTDSSTFRDANGNVVANSAQGSKTLDWISNVGNAAVPGSVPNQTGSSDQPSGQTQIVTGNVSGLNFYSGKAKLGPTSPAAANDTADKQSSTQFGYRTGGDGHLLDNNNLVGSGGSNGPNPPKVVADGDVIADEGQHQQSGQNPLPAPAAAPAAPNLVEANHIEGGQVMPATQPVVDDRKIIRTGTMEFDVDRFDSAQMNITKIVGELGGFVGATNSTKLPNGKVRGDISVRVPPGRLDALVLSLRALGDLKSQQITAADVTKEYTDIESELTADRAMQERLLALIHDGKGTVKDLLAAENELGTWREKIEKAEGMIRYYNAQVAMSTLTISLVEKDIQTPAAAVETETADVGLEADDVEKARGNAMKLIDDAGGRIVQSELKRFDAGQLAAKLVADVPPESAGNVIDQLKLLGKVARLEIQRQQNTVDGSPLPATMTATVEKDYKIGAGDLLSITVQDLVGLGVETTKELRVSDTGEVDLPLIGKIKAAGMTTDELAKAAADAYKARQVITNAQITVKVVESHGSSVLSGPLRTQRRPTRLLLSIYNLANVAPRRTTNVSLAAADVESAYNALATAAKDAGGRVVTSNLDRGDPTKTTGALVLEFPPSQLESAMTILRAQGDVLKLTVVQNQDTQNSTEAKQGLTVQLVSLAAVPPRESITQTIAAVDVPAAYQAVLNAINSSAVTIGKGGVTVTAQVPNAHGRVLSSQLNEQDRQNISADLQLEIPRATEADFDKALAAAGVSISRTAAQSPQAEGTVDSKVQLHLSITSADHLPPRETTKLQIEVPDADKSAANAQAMAIAAGGRVIEATVTKDRGKGLARLILDVPLEKNGEALQQLRDAGTVRGIDSARDAQAPTGQLAHSLIFVEFTTTDAIVADQTGPWASVRSGLSTSITGLLWSLQWLVVGLCLILPWAVVGWIGWKIMRRRRVKAAV